MTVDGHVRTRDQGRKTPSGGVAPAAITSQDGDAVAAPTAAADSSAASGSTDDEPGQLASALLSVDIFFDAADGLDDLDHVDHLDAALSSRQTAWRNAIEDAAAALARQPGLIETPSIAAILISSDDHVRRLNAGYRSQDKPTNVLSFPSAGAAPCEPGLPRHLGDMVIATGVLEREAADQGIAVVHHLQHLAVHGLLHLLGFDHETSESDAEAMEAIEITILAGLGVPNPYEPTTKARPEQIQHARKKS